MRSRATAAKNRLPTCRWSSNLHRSRSGTQEQRHPNIPANDKKLFWIEGTTRRWDGYNYFPEHAEQMIEWFDAHMG
jgi:hypothetical protein